mmetsp:Transcript_36256/g.90240  ORF Transcript_36256/g.90240 Transcript_36256/m.90240 type:complete len:210 (+) Transcript_36256:868-1497(+)
MSAARVSPSEAAQSVSLRISRSHVAPVTCSLAPSRFSRRTSAAAGRCSKSLAPDAVAAVQDERIASTSAAHDVSDAARSRRAGSEGSRMALDEPRVRNASSSAGSHGVRTRHFTFAASSHALASETASTSRFRSARSCADWSWHHCASCGESAASSCGPAASAPPSSAFGSTSAGSSPRTPSSFARAREASSSASSSCRGAAVPSSLSS